jgi:hypothetical protein
MVEKILTKTCILIPKSEAEKPVLLKLTDTSKEINLNIYNQTDYNMLCIFMTLCEHNE